MKKLVTAFTMLVSLVSMQSFAEPHNFSDKEKENIKHTFFVHTNFDCFGLINRKLISNLGYDSSVNVEVNNYFFSNKLYVEIDFTEGKYAGEHFEFSVTDASNPWYTKFELIEKEYDGKFESPQKAFKSICVDAAKRTFNLKEPRAMAYNTIFFHAYDFDDSYYKKHNMLKTEHGTLRGKRALIEQFRNNPKTPICMNVNVDTHGFLHVMGKCDKSINIEWVKNRMALHGRYIPTTQAEMERFQVPPKFERSMSRTDGYDTDFKFNAIYKRKKNLKTRYSFQNHEKDRQVFLAPDLMDETSKEVLEFAYALQRARKGFVGLLRKREDYRPTFCFYTYNKDVEAYEQIRICKDGFRVKI